MAQIDLGRVVGDTGTSIRYRGDWESTVEYLNNNTYIDTVAHDDCLWICKVANANQEPTRESTYWDMAAAGTGVYASGSTETPPISIALDADTLGGQAPSYYAKQSDLDTITQTIPSPFKVRLVNNGRGALICPSDGIYMLLAGCRHDSAVYLEAMVTKHPNINDGAPKVTVLKSAGMSVEATNSGGTIAVIATGIEDSLIRMCSIQFGSIT